MSPGPISKLPLGMNHKHPFWVSWRHMKDRCLNTKSNSYKDYGLRGITVCERWLDFQNFYDDMYPLYSDRLTIERLDNNKGYSLENCTWIPRSEQNKNRRNVKRFNGKLLSEWSIELGINRSTLEMRYYSYGWDIEKTLNTPVRKMRIKI